MAIPLSNEQREVRAPQTADVRAIDPSQAIRGAYQAQSSLMSAMGNLAEGGATLIKKVDETNDAFLRNEAETEYNETTARLNEELATKSLEERVKFQPKYEAEMQKASDIYESKINKVKNFQIREGSKRSINAWNLHNASNYQYQNYQNETDLQQKSMAQALITDNEKRINVIDPSQTAESLTKLATDPEMGFSHGEQLIRDFYGKRMGYPQEVVDQYVKDYKSKASVAMAQRLVQVTKEYTGNGAYTPAINFINYGIKQGFISPEDGIKAKRDIETERLGVNVLHHPDWFVDKSGKFDPSGRNRFAPDITQYEYERIAKHAEEANRSLTGAIEAPTKIVFEDRWRRSELDFRLQTGLVTDEDKKAFARLIGLNPDSDDVKKQLTKYFEDKAAKLDTSKIRKHLIGLQDLQNQPVIVDVTGKLLNETPSADDIAKAINDKTLHIMYPLRGNKELTDAVESYSDMLQMAYVIPGFNKDAPSWSQGVTLTRDQKADRMVTVMSDQLRNAGIEFSFAMQDDIITTMNKLLQNGFSVSDGTTDANGNPRKQLVQLNMLDNSNDRDFQENYYMGLALKEAMRRNVPTDAIQKMAQAQREYRESRHALYNRLDDMSGNLPGGMFFTTYSFGGDQAFMAPSFLPGFMNPAQRSKETKQAWKNIMNVIAPQKKGLTQGDIDTYKQNALDMQQQLDLLFQGEQ